MNRSLARARVALAAGALLLGVAASAQELLSSTAAPGAVRVEAHAGADLGVTGTVYNGTDATVTQVEVLIRHDWLWANETKPGTDDPAWADRVLITDPIPPGGQLRFTRVPARPVPARTDGRFVTSVRVGAYQTVSGG